MRSDDYGNLWIGADQGLFRVNGRTGRIEELHEHRGKPLHSINGIAFDHEGSVWLSSYGEGLYQLRRGKFDNYTVADGLADEKVNAVYEQDPNTVLIGTDDGTVNVIRDGVASTLRLRQLMPNARVRHFLEDSQGNLWISTYSGLLQVADGHEKLYTAGDGLPTNQVRFTKVRVRYRLIGFDEDWVVIRDNGIGIDPAFHKKVFGLFDRLARDQHGTGIGLAIVKRIIEVHDGRVWVESQGQGTGCTFCFTLPLIAQAW